MGQRVTVQFPLGGGLDQKTSPHYLDPNARLATVVNGNFAKLGVVDKRLGVSYAGASSKDGIKQLVSWSKADLAVCSQGLLATTDTAAGVQSVVGPLPPAQTIRRALQITPSSINLAPVVSDYPVGARTFRLVVQAGPQLGGAATVYASVIDAATQQTILPTTLIYTGSGSALCYAVNVLYLPNAPVAEQLAIFLVDTASTALVAVNYVASTTSFTAATTVCVSSTLSIYDVAPFVNDGTGRYVVAYANTGGNDYLFSIMTPAHTVSNGPNIVEVAAGGFTVNNAANQILACAQAGANELIWFQYTFFQGGSITHQDVRTCARTSATFASFLAPTSIGVFQAPVYLTGPVRVGATTGWMGYVIPVNLGSSSTSTFEGAFVELNSAGIIAGAAGTIPVGYFPIARPVNVRTPNDPLGTIYLPSVLVLGQQATGSPGTTGGGSLQGTYYLLMLTSRAGGQVNLMLPVATAAPRQVDLSSVTLGIMSANHPPFPSSGASGLPSSLFGVAVRTMGAETPSAAPASAFSGALGLNSTAWLVVHNFAGLEYQTCELGGELHLSGGSPFLCDGQLTFEDNFFYYPEFAFAAASGPIGSTIPATGAGSYQYAVMYTYADAAGLIHRSAPVFTNVVSVTNGGACAQVTFPYLATWRDALVGPGQSGVVFAEIYRTTSSPPEPEYFLLDRVPCSGNNFAPFVIYTDGAAGAVGHDDASLSSASVLYTTGGVLDQIHPPSLNGVTIHKGRVFAVDDTLQTIWFTQQYSVGLAPGWNEALTIPFSDGGDITALVSLDSALVVFKAASIWVIYGGDGPSQTATGSDLTTPAPIPSDVGAVDWRSVVVTPAGAMFAAATGIYLLDRSLAVTFVGRNVVDLFVSFPICVGAVMVPGSTQVRFAMQNAAGTASIVLVYDYLLQEWTEHTYAQQPAPIVSLTLSQSGVYSVLTSDGALWQESAATWLDTDSANATHFVPTTITLAEIKTQGSGPLQGYQRARWIQLYADQLDACAITMGVAFNGVPTIEETQSWTWSQLRGLPYNTVAHHVGALHTKCMSVQVTFSDGADAATAPSTGQGARWAGVAIELDFLRDRYRAVPVQNRG